MATTTTRSKGQGRAPSNQPSIGANEAITTAHPELKLNQLRRSPLIATSNVVYPQPPPEVEDSSPTPSNPPVPSKDSARTGVGGTPRDARGPSAHFVSPGPSTLPAQSSSGRKNPKISRAKYDQLVIQLKLERGRRELAEQSLHAQAAAPAPRRKKRSDRRESTILDEISPFQNERRRATTPIPSVERQQSFAGFGRHPHTEHQTAGAPDGPSDSNDDSDTTSRSRRSNRRPPDKVFAPRLDERASSIPFTGHLGRSRLLAPPPKLSDGCNPTAAAWKFQILQRLRANRDHYSSEDLARGFVLGTVEGSAAETVETQYEAEPGDASYRTAAQLLQDLEKAFTDPHAEGKALVRFNKLTMDDEDDFTLFRLQFEQLTAKAKIPRNEWLGKMKEKMSSRLTILTAACIDGYTVYGDLCVKLAEASWAYSEGTRKASERKALSASTPRKEIGIFKTDRTSSVSLPPGQTFRHRGSIQAEHPSLPYERYCHHIGFTTPCWRKLDHHYHQTDQCRRTRYLLQLLAAWPQEAGVH